MINVSNIIFENIDRLIDVKLEMDDVSLEVKSKVVELEFGITNEITRFERNFETNLEYDIHDRITY